jgi:putative membrane protein
LLRDDWIGWTATGLLTVGLLAGVVLAGREVVGLFRLSRLAGLRREADRALAGHDVKGELAVARRLTTLLDGRKDLAWALARFREHQRDVLDPGALLALADRDLMTPLDGQARRLVMKSSKRVATVTAISPMALIAVGFVAVENLRMMRQLAALYGGRPGLLGGLRLFRLVVGHLIATGGVALTDDLIGQFLGQDVLRRLSRRLGEGAFNGALTARLGTAAIEVTRPLPYIEAPPIRARDFVVELFRKDKEAVASAGGAGKA